MWGDPEWQGIPQNTPWKGGTYLPVWGILDDQEYPDAHHTQHDQDDTIVEGGLLAVPHEHMHGERVHDPRRKNKMMGEKVM